MDNFDLRKYLAEGKLLKEDFEDFPNQKYYDLLNDLRDAGLLNKSGISGLQSKFNLSKEKAKEIFDEYLKDLEAEQPDAFDFFMRDLNERQFFDDKQLANDILRNQADVERQLDTKLKDFKFSGDDRVFTAVDPEEFTVYAFKYRDERDPKFPYKDEEPFLSDEGYKPQIIKVDGKKVAVTVGNI